MGISPFTVRLIPQQIITIVISYVEVILELNTSMLLQTCKTHPGIRQWQSKHQ